MSLDCNKTLDYMVGFNKMCESFEDSCGSCPLSGIGCGADSITQEHIDIVQEWSDEHREKSNVEVLRELFPKVKASNLCPNSFLRYKDSLECECTDCFVCKRDFWNASHKKNEVCE